MKKLKYFICFLLSFVLIATNQSLSFAGTTLIIDGEQYDYNADPIILKINGEVLDQSTLPMQPIIIEGTTLVPVREVFESLGAVVDYKQDTKEVFIGYNKKLITMQINNSTYYVDGESFTFPVAPKIINDKTMIPLRAVSEGMGLLVDWDNATRTITIDESEPVEPITPEPEIVPAVDVSAYPFIDLPSNVANVYSLKSDTNSITILFDSPVYGISKVLLEDNRLILDYVNTTNNLSSSYSISENPYFSAIRTSQFQGDPTPVSRTVIEVNDGVYFSTLLSDDRQTLKILFGNQNTNFPSHIDTEIDHSNDNIDQTIDPNPIIPVAPNDSLISFDTNSHSIFISKDTGITTSSVSIDDYDAYRKNIIVNFDADYSNTFGYGTKSTNDLYINSITSDVENGKSEFLVKLNAWGTLSVTENSTHVIISFADPHDIYDKIVVIDAGHGDTDVGTTGFNMYEKDLNINVALKFGKLVEQNSDIKVYYTRIDDTLLDLASIGQFASAMGDLLFSVHTNGFSTAIPHGVEVLYLEHSNDATIGISSEDCADIVAENLATDTGLYNRGVKRSNLVIFRNSTIPSVLGEMGFLSSPVDAAYLASDDYLTTVAESYAKSTIEIFNQYTPQR